MSVAFLCFDFVDLCRRFYDFAKNKIIAIFFRLYRCFVVRLANKGENLRIDFRVGIFVEVMD